MSPRVRALLIWAPRLLGLAMVAFLALFAFDAFQGQPIGRGMLAFAIHLLPSAIVMAVLAVSWRHPLIGAAAFGALAIAYAAMAPARLDWVLTISGPLALIAMLFAMSAAGHSRTAAPRPAPESHARS